MVGPPSAQRRDRVSTCLAQGSADLSSDEIQPSCTACQRLGMPCGRYGVTLSKAAYNEQKQSFLEQVRRKGTHSDSRIKRAKKIPTHSAEQAAQQEQLEMQMQLGMATIQGLHPDDVSGIDPELAAHHFVTEVSHDYYPHVHQYDPTQQGGLVHENSSNLFEINPRAATIHQQLQQLQSATREHDEMHSTGEVMQDHSHSYADDPTQPFPDDPGMTADSQNEPYVPSMITIDNLMNQQQHAMRAEQQRAAEEAAVRARKEETLNQQRRIQIQHDPVLQ